jgi:hypothetical protein
MEMEMEVQDDIRASAMDASAALVERLAAATDLLEEVADRLAAREVSLDASLGRSGSREVELEGLLAEAEATIVSLKAGRKTTAAGVATLLAKEGHGVEVGALDAALVSLSPEQRIAVKAQLMRSGMLG